MWTFRSYFVILPQKSEDCALNSIPPTLNIIGVIKLKVMNRNT